MSIHNLIKTQMEWLTEEQLIKLARYYELLIDWNENRCNLTSITKVDEVISKHFADSLLPRDLIPEGAICIDVGTGAGFPGVPLKIVRPDIKMVLMDSLQKRIDFLDMLTEELNIDAETIHSRAEDGGRDIRLRGNFDIVLTRAVAQTSILLEWTSPFLKIGGKSLMYKGTGADEELRECNNALKILGLTARTIHYDVSWGERTVVCAEKISDTPKAYPRKAGMAKKKPL